jgi:pimeloyl-ACP methyl ester carboxylesterase
MSLFFDDIGNGNPVVLIHAFPLSRKMWTAQSELLVNNGFRVILIDLPGLGEGESSGFHSIEEMAAKIAELLESLIIRKAIIGGISMGGYVLFKLFRYAPELFSALILCDTTFLADSVEKRNSRIELISKIEKQGAAALIENMLPNLISGDTQQNNPALVAKLKEMFLEVNPSAAINALRSMAERSDSSDIINNIFAPALLLFGEFDKVTNLENARQMNHLISDSELVVIENAGHFSNLEQPEQFNRALLNFCRRVQF